MQNIINISHIHDDFFLQKEHEVNTILDILHTTTRLVPNRMLYAHGINTLCKGDINHYMDFIHALFYEFHISEKEMPLYEDWFYQNTSLGDVIICILTQKNQHV